MDTEKYLELESDFMEYQSEAEGTIDEIKNEGRKHYDQSLYFIQTMQLMVSYVAENGYVDHEVKEIKAVITKLFHELGGAYSCLKNGYIHPTNHIMRSLFEQDLSIEYLYKDYDNRIDLYVNYKYIDLYKHMDGHDLSQDYIDDITEKYRRYYNDYFENRGSWFSKYLVNNLGGGSGSIRQLAKHLDREEEYNRTYGSLSAVSHASSSGDVLVSDGDRLMLKPHYNQNTENFTHFILLSSYKILFEILRDYEELRTMIGNFTINASDS